MVFHRLRGFFFYFDLKKGRIFFDSIVKRKNPWWVWLLPLPIVWWAALLVAGSWSDGMSLVDDVGGVGGFCEFLETINGDDPEEKKSYKIWARSLGWTGRMPKPENML